MDKGLKCKTRKKIKDHNKIELLWIIYYKKR